MAFDVQGLLPPRERERRTFLAISLLFSLREYDGFSLSEPSQHFSHSCSQMDWQRQQSCAATGGDQRPADGLTQQYSSHSFPIRKRMVVSLHTAGVVHPLRLPNEKDPWRAAKKIRQTSCGCVERTRSTIAGSSCCPLQSADHGRDLGWIDRIERSTARAAEV